MIKKPKGWLVTQAENDKVMAGVKYEDTQTRDVKGRIPPRQETFLPRGEQMASLG